MTQETEINASAPLAKPWKVIPTQMFFGRQGQKSSHCRSVQENKQRVRALFAPKRHPLSAHIARREQCFSAKVSALICNDDTANATHDEKQHMHSLSCPLACAPCENKAKRVDFNLTLCNQILCAIAV